MSGVNISTDYLAQMDNPSALMLGTITALYDVGAAVGAIVAAFTAERLGRRRTLISGAVALIIGSILMAASYGRPQFMVGRFATGVGIGYLTGVAPVYQSEVARAAHRGWMVCCQVTTMLGGLMVAYWINYGFYFVKNSAQWRFPLAFQMVFAIYIVIITTFLPDTPRWLMRHDRPENPSRSLAVLARFRNRPEDDKTVLAELDAIKHAIGLEAAQEGSWSDLFRSNGMQANKRFYLALGIQFMQQMTGINIGECRVILFHAEDEKMLTCSQVTYYAPTLYQESLGMSQEMSLFLGCWTQVWYILASFVTWYTIDRIGRRKLYISQAIGMTCVLIGEAICVKVNNHGASIGAVVFVFLFEACFTWGWMATVWVYPPEILPLKIRAKGASLAAAADFLGNFLVVEVTPVGLQNIGWKFYLVWAVLNLVCATIVFFCYPETGGLPLEAIDDLFVEDSEYQNNATGVFNRFQWRYVARSKKAVREWKKVSSVEGGRRESVQATGLEKEVTTDSSSQSSSSDHDKKTEAEHSESQNEV
ncbi:MAG: hypothetical protein Q9162_000676 [Coniocarpon cinnabarinum]